MMSFDVLYQKGKTMIIRKKCYGYVLQLFDTEKNQFVSQEFCEDYVEYTTESGSPIDDDFFEMNVDSWPDLPFDLVQPK